MIYTVVKQNDKSPIIKGVPNNHVISPQNFRGEILMNNQYSL